MAGGFPAEPASVVSRRCHSIRNRVGPQPLDIGVMPQKIHRRRFDRLLEIRRSQRSPMNHRKEFKNVFLNQILSLRPSLTPFCPSGAVTLRSTSNGDQHPCRGVSGLRQPTTSCVGKQIVYAVTDLIAPSLEQLLAAEPNDSPMRPLDAEPLLADIPIPNSPIAAGWPICTVFARAETVSACRALLELRVSVVRIWTK